MFYSCGFHVDSLKPLQRGDPGLIVIYSFSSLGTICCLWEVHISAQRGEFYYSNYCLLNYRVIH